MKGHGSKFHRKMYPAIAALLKCATVQEAAKEVGIAPNTLSRWMAIPEFRAAHREALRTEFFQSRFLLRQASPAAATTVVKNMLDPKAPHSLRQKAAEFILDNSAKTIEDEDVIERLEELENVVKNELGNRKRLSGT